MLNKKFTSNAQKFSALFALSFAFVSCGLPTNNQSAQVESLQAYSEKNGTSLRLFSQTNGVVPGTRTLARCYYFIETGKVLDIEEALSHPKLKLLNAEAVPDAVLRNVLEKEVRKNLGSIFIAGSGAAGACAGAFTGASALVATLLGPGTQVVAPAALLMTLGSLVGCGVSAKAASTVLWQAWLYNDLKEDFPLSDVNVATVKKPEEALRALVSALSSAQFHALEGQACPARPH